jgi:YfiH family protein
MIPYLTAPFLSKIPYLSHGFFGRQGGVSTGLFASLNTSRFKGDDETNVDENRRRIATALGFMSSNLVVVKQVHGPRVYEALSPTVGDAPPADAIITQTPGLLLGIQTADCVPILIADTSRPLVAAIHAGWRGTLAGVIEQTREVLCQKGAKPSHLVAAIGPCIWQTSYEVSEDVYTAACAATPNTTRFFMPAAKPGFYWFDLPGLVHHKLHALSITCVNASPANTYTQEEMFFSFRRKTHRGETSVGGQLSVIGIKGTP